MGREARRRGCRLQSEAEGEEAESGEHLLVRRRKSRTHEKTETTRQRPLLMERKRATGPCNARRPEKCTSLGGGVHPTEK